jgi:CDP-glycerol glycerophosphotransferase (TagB/SpsB family)
MQHGILYPKYFSYRHDKDEEDCPRPTRTALFGEAAKEFLVEQGRYDPASLVLTGSPKFDALLEASKAWDRNALRARCGVKEGETLILVASRYRGILPTHRAIGSVFVPFLRAAMSRDDVRVLVKPHPAERRDGYEAGIRESGASRVGVLRRNESLVELLFACDVLVTVESLSAIEALVLDRRVLVLNMPSNLRELVESGAALGVSSGEDPSQALGKILEDPKTLLGLKNARMSYLSKVAMGVDGRATERIVALVRDVLPAAARSEP